MKATPTTHTCAVSRRTLPAEECVPCNALRPSLLSFVQKQHPEITPDDWIARDLLPG